MENACKADVKLFASRLCNVGVINIIQCDCQSFLMLRRENCFGFFLMQHVLLENNNCDV